MRTLFFKSGFPLVLLLWLGIGNSVGADLKTVAPNAEKNSSGQTSNRSNTLEKGSGGVSESGVGRFFEGSNSRSVQSTGSKAMPTATPATVSSSDTVSSTPTPTLVPTSSTPTPAVTDSIISAEKLIEFNVDFGKSHEYTPAGVPPAYSWARWPRLGAGNRPPSGFGAITGWGHIFFSSYPTGGDPGLVQLRNMNVFLCQKTDGKWRRIQSGQIAGGEYRGDFSGNISKAPKVFHVLSDGVAEVQFDFGNTFHFWPKQGRKALPTTNICGVLVIVEARVVPGTSNGAGKYLLGLGADYWTNVSSPWDNFKTNSDVAIGRLKVIGSAWDWFGVSTASDTDLLKFVADGYIE